MGKLDRTEKESQTGLDDERGDDEIDLFIVSQKSLGDSVQDIIFQLVFFLVHGNSSDPSLGIFFFLLEDVQLLLVFLSSSVSSVYNVPIWLSSNLEVLYQTKTIDVYQIYFWTATGLVTVFSLNSFYVAYGVWKGQHNFIWPIRTLRVLGSYLPTVFQIELLSIFFASFYCYGGLERGTCAFDTPLYYLIVGIICVVVYLPGSILLSFSFISTDPTRKGTEHLVHGTHLFIYSIMKILITISKLLAIGSYAWVTIVIAFTAPFGLYCSMLYHFPYYSPILNHLRAGVYGCISGAGCVAIGCLVYSYLTGSPAPSISLVYMIAVMIPGFVLGYYGSSFVYEILSRRCYRFLTSRIGVEEEVGSKKRHLHNDNQLVFWAWPHVEITARLFTRQLTDRKRFIAPEKLEEIRKIFNRGVFEFPDIAQVRLSYATYLFHLNCHLDEARKQIKAIPPLHPPFGIRFQTFFLKQISSQSRKTGHLGRNVHLDVSGFEEFRKLDQIAR